MDIGGTSLSSLYSGNSFSGNFSSSQAIGVEQTPSIDSVNSANAPKNDSQNTSSSKDQSSEQSSEKQSQTANKTQTNDNQTAVNLSESDVKQVQKLKQRDTEVRNHESAHLAAAGKYATGGASFEYKRGPDGKNYAVGGEVGIDTSPIPNDPEGTIQKARQIKSAAQAPANPSSTDRQVAASAGQMEIQARQEIAELRISGEAENQFPTKGLSDSNVVKDSEANDKSTKTSHNKIATSQYQAIDKMSQGEKNQTASLIEAFA